VLRDHLERLGLEYRFIAEYVQGRIRAKNDLLQKLYNAICQYAKRQDTWFRRMERNGFTVAVFNRTVSKVDDFIKGRGQGKKLQGGN
jgi:tRNA A37 N6-isopentenylltransferase MiaA